MTKMMLFVVAGLMLLLISGCARQERSLPGDSVGRDGEIRLTPKSSVQQPPAEETGVIENLLYPPELIMEHQSELGIDLSQKNAILKEVDRGQSELLHLGWQLQGEKEKLVKVLEGEKVDEQMAQDAAARVMDVETKVKASHLALLVRIKNMLTPGQQQKLHAWRNACSVK
jgi:hypothetical protein